jgi:hypothetical protein
MEILPGSRCRRAGDEIRMMVDKENVTTIVKPFSSHAGREMP